jgi:uncharacterized protein YqjF (DUF2071 family)
MTRNWSVPHDFNYDVVRDVGHRPWAMPDGPWLFTQTWTDLLFAHWPIDSGRLRPFVPQPFELDLFGHQAWVGVVPFQMSNVSPRGVPSLPRLSAFPEVNVRTYVRVDDKPGVFFFSLDAASAVAVRAARLLLNLPYYQAEMMLTTTPDGVVDFCTARRGGGADLVARYWPAGPAAAALRGSLEYFLTERYCLYHMSRRQVPYRLDIHHPPWLLQAATAEFDRNTLAAPIGLSLPGAPPLLHFSKRQDTLAWAPTSVLET